MEGELLSVASLHAIAYCERLFYLEEVERIRLVDGAMFAGRRLHVDVLPSEKEDGDWKRPYLESDQLGIHGTVDLLRRRDGKLVVYEHKRGRASGTKSAREAWSSEKAQVGAYALLVEEAFGQPIDEGRVRYHASNATVRIPIDGPLREEVHRLIRRGNALRKEVERPPIVENESLCQRCSLAPACLPEEARLATDPKFQPVRLLPPHPDRQTLHVLQSGSRVSRSKGTLVVKDRDGVSTSHPVKRIGSIALHGLAQITSQAIRLCADEDIRVTWLTRSGGVVAVACDGPSSPQRHIRQFEALRDPLRALALARSTMVAKIENGLRYILRATRANASQRTDATDVINRLRSAVRRAAAAKDAATLRGCEGDAANAYFAGLASLLSGELDPRFRYITRSRRPPRDCINALLSFGYGQLYRLVVGTLVSVGLHPGFGYYHRPRSSAQPLALDLMELFRGPIVDMAVVAAVNQRVFDADSDFQNVPNGLLLSESGRSKMLTVFERRLMVEWRHAAIGYSLSYARMVELEARLLEKEWSGEGGLFARFRLR